MGGRRIRTVKPEWLEDDRLLQAGSDARVLSIALITLADDDGRGRITLSTPTLVFPIEGPDAFSEALARLEDWFVRRYWVRKQEYFEIINWHKHQRVDKPTKSHIPAPPERPGIPLGGLQEASWRPLGGLPVGPGPGPGPGPGEEGKGREGGGSPNGDKGNDDGLGSAAAAKEQKQGLKTSDTSTPDELEEGPFAAASHETTSHDVKGAVRQQSTLADKREESGNGPLTPGEAMLARTRALQAARDPEAEELGWFQNEWTAARRRRGKADLCRDLSPKQLEWLQQTFLPEVQALVPEQGVRRDVVSGVLDGFFASVSRKTMPLTKNSGRPMSAFGYFQRNSENVMGEIKERIRKREGAVASLAKPQRDDSLEREEGEEHCE